MSSQIPTAIVESATFAAPISSQTHISKLPNNLNRSRSHSPNSASDSEPPSSALSATGGSQISHSSLTVERDARHLDIDQLRAKISETKRKIALREQKEQGKKLF